MVQNTRVKISDIAKAAGVSCSTVSYALNGKRSISTETRDRILKEVERLGYKPNAMARSFVTNQSNTIGLYVNRELDASDLFMLSNILGINSVINDLRYKILLLNELEGKVLEDYSIPVDRTFAIDGAIVCNARNMRWYLREFEKERLPFVLMGKPPRGVDIYHVDNDNQDTAYRVVRHFFHQGRTRIALVMNAAQETTFNLDYISGYTTAHNDYQIEFHPEFILRAQETRLEDFVEMVQQRQIDGILLISSDASYRRYCLSTESLGVPVVFFGLDLYREFLAPPRPGSDLRYIESNAQALGRACAEVLMQLMRGEHPPKTQLLKQRVLPYE